MKNIEIQLVSRPVGMPVHDNFAFVESDIPELQEGEILVENEYMSVDPYMRGRMEEGDSYIEPFKFNAPMEGHAVGKVAVSNHPDYPVDEYVTHMHGWRKYAVLRPGE